MPGGRGTAMEPLWPRRVPSGRHFAGVSSPVPTFPHYHPRYSTGFISEAMLGEHLPPPGEHSYIFMCGPMWTKQRPEASANSPSSTPRQRQIKRRAASCLGQPRPIGRCALAGHILALFSRTGAARRPCSTARASPTWPSSATPRATSTASETDASEFLCSLPRFASESRHRTQDPRARIVPARVGEPPRSGLALCACGVNRGA